MEIFSDINLALPEMLSKLKRNSVYRKPKNQARGSYELKGPTVICLTNPLAVYTLTPERKLNVPLGMAEAIWIAGGFNDLDVLPGHYAKAVYQYADDGRHYRAGYGPRIRKYNGKTDQYAVGERSRSTGVDQLKYVAEVLKNDPNSRQALITIHDPVKDDFGPDGKLLATKDTPCTRTLHFMADYDGNLDMYVHMRSNDALHGWNAINSIEFSFLFQLVCQLTGLPMGNYYHIANSFHYYEDLEEMVNNIVKAPPRVIPEMADFRYPALPLTIADIDNAIGWTLRYEKMVRIDRDFEAPNPFQKHPELAVFSDACEVFRAHWAKKDRFELDSDSMFLHPQLKAFYRSSN